MTPTEARKLTVTGSEVHVWWIDEARRDDGALTPEELERCARFRNDSDRQRFAARRAGLRRVLSGYTSLDASAVVLDRSCRYCGDPSHGRPRLAGDHDLSFSAASAPGHVVVAVAPAAMTIGIDIEPLTRFDPTAAGDVWRAAMTPAERGAVNTRDAHAIGRLWCRKEAVLKAMGLGIAGHGPDRLDVRSRHHRRVARCRSSDTADVGRCPCGNLADQPTRLDVRGTQSADLARPRSTRGRER